MRTVIIAVIISAEYGFWAGIVALLLCWKISDCEHQKGKP